MKAIESKTLLEALNWRYATKTFDPERKLSADTLEALEESMRLTPSSFGLQPWKFIVIGSDAIKEKLPPISWDQQQLKDCSHVVVLAAKVKYTREDVADFITCTAEARNQTEESLSGYEQFAGGFVDQANEQGFVEEWTKKQVYIALGQLMLSAALLGVDACPMEGIQPADYDKVLGLEGTDYATVVACPLGYRSESDKYASAAKARYSKEKVIDRR